MKKIILSVLVLSVIAFSCKSKKMTAKMAKIETGKFAVVKIDGIDEVKNNPTMEIDFINKKISGSSACNNYGGDFTSEKNNIKFNALMSTKRYCQEFAKIEKQFYKNLKLVAYYEIKDNQILLYDKADTLMIVGELKTDN